MKITEQDKINSERAVQMLISVQCIQFAIYDLIDELGEKYKHDLKKRIKIADRDVNEITKKAWQVFSKNTKVAEGFIDTSLEIYNKIDKSVILDNKYINIIDNLKDLALELNDRLPYRYKFDYLDKLNNIISLINIKFKKQSFIKAVIISKLNARSFVNNK